VEFPTNYWVLAGALGGREVLSTTVLKIRILLIQVDPRNDEPFSLLPVAIPMHCRKGQNGLIPTYGGPTRPNVRELSVQARCPGSIRFLEQLVPAMFLSMELRRLISRSPLAVFRLLRKAELVVKPGVTYIMVIIMINDQ